MAATIGFFGHPRSDSIIIGKLNPVLQHIMPI
jgi:hypothetical protein